MGQRLTRGVEHAEESNLRTQMLRICCDTTQRLARRPEQDVVDLLLVLIANGCNGLWYRKYDMKINDTKKFRLTFLQPLGRS
jgi:hypothetical protein